MLAKTILRGQVGIFNFFPSYLLWSMDTVQWAACPCHVCASLLDTSTCSTRFEHVFHLSIFIRICLGCKYFESVSRSFNKRLKKKNAHLHESLFLTCQKKCGLFSLFPTMSSLILHLLNLFHLLYYLWCCSYLLSK